METNNITGNDHTINIYFGKILETFENAMIDPLIKVWGYKTRDYNINNPS